MSSTQTVKNVFEALPETGRSFKEKNGKNIIVIEVVSFLSNKPSSRQTQINASVGTSFKRQDHLSCWTPFHCPVCLVAKNSLVHRKVFTTSRTNPGHRPGHTASYLVPGIPEGTLTPITEPAALVISIRKINKDIIVSSQVLHDLNHLSLVSTDAKRHDCFRIRVTGLGDIFRSGKQERPAIFPYWHWKTS